jgi:hypothetical protein
VHQEEFWIKGVTTEKKGGWRSGLQVNRSRKSPGYGIDKSGFPQPAMRPCADHLTPSASVSSFISMSLKTGQGECGRN